MQQVMSVKEFHEAMGKTIGKNEIYNQCHTGKIKNFRIGAKIVILASEITDWPQRLANPTS